MFANTEKQLLIWQLLFSFPRVAMAMKVGAACRLEATSANAAAPGMPSPGKFQQKFAKALDFAPALAVN